MRAVKLSGILAAVTVTLLLLSLVPVHVIAGQVSAQSVGPGQCVKKKPTDCQPKNNGGGGGGSATGAGGTGTPADQAACAGLTQLNGANCNSNDGQSAIGNIANRVVTILSYLAGIIAVIMIIVAGFRYITSGGDSAKVGGAKTALAYALVGVAIAVLAQVLVHFVIGTAVTG
jgi:hypothetical protein